MPIHACDTSTLEMMPDGSEVQGHPPLYCVVEASLKHMRPCPFYLLPKGKEGRKGGREGGKKKEKKKERKEGKGGVTECTQTW